MRWQGCALAASVVIALSGGVGGCASGGSEGNTKKAGSAGAERASGGSQATTGRDETREFDAPARAAALPSLAAEMRAQGSRKASGLESRIGLRIEEVSKGTAPAWWASAANDRTRYCATGTDRELEKAYEQAVTRAGAIAANPMEPGASAVDPRVLSPERVAWTRLVTGEYAVWAVMVPPGVPRQIATGAPPAVALNGAVTPTTSAAPASNVTTVNGATVTTIPANGGEVAAAATPATTPVVAQPALPAVPQPVPQAVDPNADPLAPGWWRAEPISAGGRMTVGTRAEGENGKIASKAAVAEAKKTLSAALGAEAKDVITLRSVTMDLPDGRVRAYVLVSGRK